MATTRSDLLSSTRALLRWAFYFDAFLVLLLAVILAGLLTVGASRTSIVGLEGLSAEEKLFAARMAVCGALIACTLGLPLFHKLLAIVDSARIGDPFVPENAVRLRIVGSLLLACNVVMGIAISVALRGHITGPGFSFTSLLTVLMVFVLARIFDAGARMRADLQGTV